MREILTSDLRDIALSSHIWWGTSVENRRHGLLRIEVPGGDGATPTRSRIVKFGTFEADLNSGELYKSGLYILAALSGDRTTKIGKIHAGRTSV